MNIIKLAKEAGLPCQHPDWTEGYERFAALVRAEVLADPVKQEPVAWYGKSKTGDILLSVNCVYEDWQPLYAAPVDAKAIRAEALEEAAKVCEEGVGCEPENGCCPTYWEEAQNECAAAIRGLK